MLFKLSIKNIRKSIKDYSIYFFTLVVAVSIFYIFNSLDAQKSMVVLNENSHQVIDAVIMCMDYISVFISFILAFLLIYSNNFLIKRRKKEFGLYLTLGMSKRKVSYILVIETLLVGIISLVVGLLFGVFFSQFLSIFIAKLFETNMKDFVFVFSKSAVIKTILYFSIIYITVILFNVFVISRKKLIDLLNDGKKSEKVKFRNKYIILLSFILCVVFLAYAYYLLFNGAILSLDKQFAIMIICGSIGTLLLFFSAAGFFLKIIEKLKKIYYKSLNIFVLKQINNRINTSVISTTIISLMLLITIGVLSGSISIISVYNSDFNNTNKTDFTFKSEEIECNVISNVCGSTQKESIYEKIPAKDYFKKYVKEYVYFKEYNSEKMTLYNLLDDKTKKELTKSYGQLMDLSVKIPIISESNYNALMELFDKKELKIDINSNEYILVTSVDKLAEIYKPYYLNDGKIEINDKLLYPASKTIEKINFENFSSDSNIGTIVVDDEVIKDLELVSNIIVGNYVSGNNEEIEEKFFNELINNENMSMAYTTKLEMKNANISVKAIIIFVGLYVGIVFAISSATILAIGELSQSSDNKERYLILRKIGADEKMIKKALFKQTFVTFIFPLIVAIFHSLFGLKEINNIIEVVGSLDVTKNIILTSLFIIIVYGGYFIATYLCSKTIIREK